MAGDYQARMQALAEAPDEVDDSFAGQHPIAVVLVPFGVAIAMLVAISIVALSALSSMPD